MELGALDGLTVSNTYALENCLQWKGLLIEANPESFAKIRTSGRTAAREHSAVCSGHGYVNITKHGNVFAGMPEAMSESVEDEFSGIVRASAVLDLCPSFGDPAPFAPALPIGL